MKKFKLLLLLTLVIVPNLVMAKDKVKVYIFEAGGCPYCEAEREYLEKLDGYNKTFEIVGKELYVDHVDWAEGKDYELGVRVAIAFQNAGFEDASYLGTPLVIISDTYAMAAYNTDLEKVIEEAYEVGDKDIVSCIADGKTDCLPVTVENPIDSEEVLSNRVINDGSNSSNNSGSSNNYNSSSTNDAKSNKASIIIFSSLGVILVGSLLGVIVYVVIRNKKMTK